MASRVGSPIITAMLVLHACHIVRKETRRNGFSVLLTQTAKPSVSLVPGGGMEADEKTRLQGGDYSHCVTCSYTPQGTEEVVRFCAQLKPGRQTRKKALWLCLQSVYQPLF